MILEALPFILIGVIVSAVIQVFVSDRAIERFIPRDPMLGILFACVLGIFFPVCECGLIPVVRRFVAKGMPLYVGVVFMLAGPIVNPVVFTATYTAFRTRPDIVYSRMGLAWLVSMFIGLAIYYFVRKNPLKLSHNSGHDHGGHVHSHDGDHGHNHHGGHVHDHDDKRAHDGGHRHEAGRPGDLVHRLVSMLEHAAGEFVEMGKYLVFGALMAAIIQTFVSRESLIDIGQGQVSSHLFMMGFAYVLSLCSTSDAFVASSFINTFSPGALLTFMVFGPMLSFKSTVMLLTIFRARFVMLLALLVIVAVFFGSKIIGGLFLS